jgi:hypothetical protein
VFLLLAAAGSLTADPIDDLQSAFNKPPADSRIMMRWWWFGPAVNKAELEREMRLMKEAGIGGFEVQPVYPLVLDDAENGIIQGCNSGACRQYVGQANFAGSCNLFL